jgi:hypothetical protein
MFTRYFLVALPLVAANDPGISFRCIPCNQLSFPIDDPQWYAISNFQKSIFAVVLLLQQGDEIFFGAIWVLELMTGHRPIVSYRGSNDALVI